MGPWAPSREGPKVVLSVLFTFLQGSTAGASVRCCHLTAGCGLDPARVSARCYNSISKQAKTHNAENMRDTDELMASNETCDTVNHFGRLTSSGYVWVMLNLKRHLDL